jgi:hypothetical protein
MATPRKGKIPDDVKTKPVSENRDPITGEKGAHPVGVGVGTAVGGGVAGGAIGSAAAAIAGATAAGAAAGPIGAVVGAVAGGIVGAYAGKEVAENTNPTLEDRYWEENYRSRPYIEQEITYEEYRPAYRYGWEARVRHADQAFDDVEPDLERGWNQARGRCKLDWQKAKPAVRDAWDRVDMTTARQNPTARRTEGKK